MLKGKEDFIKKWLADRAKLISEAKMAINWEGLAIKEYERIIKNDTNNNN